MSEFLPEAVRQGLKNARIAAMRRGDRMCVHDGDEVYRIRRFWNDGFSLDAGTADKLRGRVDIYDGPRHLYQCLVVGAVTEGEEQSFEFKWLTPVVDGPALDFVRPDVVPAGFIEAKA